MDGAEQTVRDIRRRTRKRYSAEEKIRIVLAGLQGENSIAGDLAEWLNDKGIRHIRGAPNDPQTHGKIEGYHESLGNLTPTDVFFGRDQAIIERRRRIKEATIRARRLARQNQAA